MNDLIGPVAADYFWSGLAALVGLALIGLAWWQGRKK